MLNISTLQKLEQADARLAHIEESLADPSIFSKREEMLKLVAEKKELSPIIEQYRVYLEASSALEEAQAMLSEESDTDFKAMIVEEIKALEKTLEEETQKLLAQLIPKNPDDSRNVVMEIRAGTGGEESALFAADLFRMYGMYAEKHRFKLERISASPTELGGFKEICFSLEGQDVYAKLKYESGVHRVQRVPKTESQGRIQTSAVTVAVLPEAEDVEIEIKPSDIKVESCKSSGAGGQHINKTESAVRITHFPSGLVIECQEERSQFKNRDKAMKLLRTKLYDMRQKEQNDAIANQRRTQVGSGDRSEKIRTYNFPQNRISDHRIQLTLYSLSAFLDGDMDEVIDALATAEMAEKLKGQQDE